MPLKFQTYALITKIDFIYRGFFVFLIIFSFVSCKKISQVQSIQPTFYVENFRYSGMDDYQALRTAIDSLPTGSRIIFGDRTYTFTHTIFLNKTLHFVGNGTTLKRENQITYTLKEPTDASSKLLVLNNTNGIKAGEILFLAFDQSYLTTTSTNWVSSINGDSLFMVNPIGVTINNIDIFPIGTKVFKSINFFGIADDTYGTVPGVNCSFSNLIFDGNRDNNQGNYSWLYNATILAPIKGTTYYTKCRFINSPAETIVGHNANIRNCFFYNLNGSAFHASADKVALTESQIYSYLSNNIIENTNQISTEIIGHSGGAITHSYSGGYYTAIENAFINVGEAVLDGLYPSTSINDWGTNDITFTRNTINGAGKLIRFISMQPGIIHDVKIDSNVISNMPSFDWSSGINYFAPGIILKDKSGE